MPRHRDKKAAEGRVLVHCMAGRSRSVTLVIAYLMKHARMRLADAFAVVKARRPIALPNVGFWQQLAAEELRLFGTPSPMPAVYDHLLELRQRLHEPSPQSLSQLC